PISTPGAPGAPAVAPAPPHHATCERIRENVRLHGVKVAMASGDVRSTAGHLPRPDAVFIGPGLIGRGGPETVRVCAGLEPARLVAVAAAGEARKMLDVLAEHGFTAGAVRLQATPLYTSGPPADPMIVVWGARDARVPGRRPSRATRPIETIPALPGEPDELDEPGRRA
ncbi:hypothetical protein AB0C35_27905, partial [Spirillospora sp. NPDC048819]